MPYSDLPESAFWARCRGTDDFLQDALFAPKFQLVPGMRVATAGSCFAQNIGRHIKASDLEFVDTEPKPRLMPEDIAGRHGYGLFSARYGNVYTTTQLLQLLEDATGEALRDCAVWRKDGQFYDALRPNVEPEGFADPAELAVHRIDHLRRVRQIFENLDVFIFTLGLTEFWLDKETGTAFPTAPGVIAGDFDPAAHAFHNAGFAAVQADLRCAIGIMRQLSPRLKILLSVSPVPLTATASGHHILRANTYSKSVLRAVAEEVAASDPDIDYFPAFELISGTPYNTRHYAENLRQVSPAGLQTVMTAFFAAYPQISFSSGAGDNEGVSIDEDVDDAICEDIMLDLFAE